MSSTNAKTKYFLTRGGKVARYDGEERKIYYDVHNKWLDKWFVDEKCKGTELELVEEVSEYYYKQEAKTDNYKKWYEAEEWRLESAELSGALEDWLDLWEDFDD